MTLIRFLPCSRLNAVVENRLYAKAVITGYKRSHHRQRPHTNVLKIQGVNCKEDTTFYLGKRVVYIYGAKTEKADSKFRVVWGKVTRSHGNKGSVRAKFSKNLPPSALAAQVRVMMYPSNI